MLAAVVEQFDAAAGEARPAPASVLDLGCGEGLPARLSRRGPGGARARSRHLDAGDRARGPAVARARVDRRERGPPSPVAGRRVRLRACRSRRAATAPRSGDCSRRRGRALLAVPGEDDLVELREAVLGRGELRDRAAKLVARTPARPRARRAAERLRGRSPSTRRRCATSSPPPTAEAGESESARGENARPARRSR